MVSAAGSSGNVSADGVYAVGRGAGENGAFNGSSAKAPFAFEQPQSISNVHSNIVLITLYDVVNLCIQNLLCYF